MAINEFLLTAALSVAALCAAAPSWSREAATPSACQAAANAPPIVAAKSALDSDPNDLQAHFKLADAWSDAGCFGDAMQVLQNAQGTHAGNPELETRLRVARSLVGEEHFFDNIDRADAEARLKRASFRCTSLNDLDACNEALRLKPDDPKLLVAQGDSLVRAKRPADALSRYRLAAVISPNQPEVADKIAQVESRLPKPSGSSIANTGAGDQATRATGAAAGQTVPSAQSGQSAQSGPSGQSAQSGQATATSAERPPLRTANIATTAANASATAAPARRYSNAAPETQSH